MLRLPIIALLLHQGYDSLNRAVIFAVENPPGFLTEPALNPTDYVGEYAVTSAGYRLDADSWGHIPSITSANLVYGRLSITSDNIAWVFVFEDFRSNQPSYFGAACFGNIHIDGDRLVVEIVGNMPVENHALLREPNEADFQTACGTMPAGTGGGTNAFTITVSKPGSAVGDLWMANVLFDIHLSRVQEPPSPVLSELTELAKPDP